MTKQEAKDGALKAHVDSGGLSIVVVNEGLHADEFARRDEDGKSYGFCPELAKPMLYRHAAIIGRVYREHGHVFVEVQP